MTIFVEFFCSFFVYLFSHSISGRRLLSGKSNRELAEKRLPDLWNYTKSVFT